jgi:hypothetical protein
MSYTKNMHELLHDVSIAPPFEKDAAISKIASNSYLKKFLSIVYNPTIEWDLPPGMPPHKRDETVPPDLAYTTLSMELKTLYIYFKPSPLQNNVKRETRFIEMLEALHYTETDLITAVKDGKFDKRYPGIEKLKMMQMLPEIFYMDGIFQRGEWIALEVTGEGHDKAYAEFIKPDNLQSFLSNKRIFSAKNFFSGEIYKSIDVEAIVPDPTVVEAIVEVVLDEIVEVIDKKSVSEPTKKSPGRPKKDSTTVTKVVKKPRVTTGKKS